MSRRRTVVAVGLWAETLNAVVRAAGAAALTVASFGDSSEAREWLGDRDDEVVVVARQDESDLWALSALLVAVRSRDPQAPVVVLSERLRAALPVLLTDLPGLVVVDPTGGRPWTRALDDAFERPLELVPARH